MTSCIPVCLFYIICMYISKTKYLLRYNIRLHLEYVKCYSGWALYGLIKKGLSNKVLFVWKNKMIIGRQPSQLNLNEVCSSAYEILKNAGHWI